MNDINFADEQPSRKPLPVADILDSDVWTPEIERLVQAIVEQIRLDQPGMIVSGAQRNGKSRACKYVESVLAEVVGYPISTFSWTMPETAAQTTRVFVQERMLQSGCTAVSHRDLAILRGRLIMHLVDQTNSISAKRIVVIVDEAQFLTRTCYGALVFIFNELERRGLRPFFVLIGQPELDDVAEEWMKAGAQQMVGRFSTRAHDYRGIQLDDLEVVLEGFDDEEDGAESTAAFRTSPGAYAEGWRVAHLAPLMRQAVREVAKAQNIQEDVRLPMQYLRSCLLSMLYRIVQNGMPPAAFPLADAIDCVKAANFARVLHYYVKKGPAPAEDNAGKKKPGKGAAAAA